MTDKLVGENIKKRRNALGLTQEDVAQHVGVNRATVQRYESGEIEVKRSVAIKLAEILETTPSYIMGWEERTVLDDYLDLLHKRPDMQALFSISKDAKKEDVEKAIKIIEMLKEK